MVVGGERTMSSLLGAYEVVIFDCDGVLIDINTMKCEAFGKAVEEYPQEIVDAFVRYCKNSFGESRYEKFKKFFSDFAKQPFELEKYNEMVDKYSAICKVHYENARLTPGVLELLGELKNNNKLLYVASGSDEEELVSAFDKRELRCFFTEIYGSPKTKQECVQLILENNQEANVVFIGDSLSDMKVSRGNNLDFIYMYDYSVQSREQDELCRSNSLENIHDLTKLL